HGGQTEGGRAAQPDPRRLRWRLRRHPPGGQAKQPCGPRERQPTQEAPPADPSSVLDPHGSLPSRCWSLRPRERRSVTVLLSHKRAQHLTIASRVISPCRGDVISLT